MGCLNKLIFQFFLNVYQVPFFNAGSRFVQNLVPPNPKVFFRTMIWLEANNSFLSLRDEYCEYALMWMP